MDNIELHEAVAKILEEGHGNEAIHNEGCARCEFFSQYVHSLYVTDMVDPENPGRYLLRMVPLDTEGSIIFYDAGE